MNAQIGYGLTASTDLYHRYVNPKDDILSPSSGSAILNLGAGPKIWIGGKGFSFSAEGQAVVGFLSLSTKDYKGLGSVAFPVLGKFNFKGLSGLNSEGQLGFSIGGGIQWNKTELWGLTDKAAEKGVKRDFFPTYVVQAGWGFGISGFTLQGIVRYGFNPDDHKSNTLNVGFQYDFNLPMLKKIDNPQSAL
ncbi:MAG: hypothetical protein LC107_07860 [Chitinophagales bacterium]|nr:hypothetical protein [Chitinophagales bacterium]